MKHLGKSVYFLPDNQMLSFLGITESDIRGISSHHHEHSHTSTPEPPATTSSTSNLLANSGNGEAPRRIRRVKKNISECIHDVSKCGDEMDEDDDFDEEGEGEIVEEGVEMTDEEFVKHIKTIADTPPVLSTMTVCGNFGGTINLQAFMDRVEIMPYWKLAMGIIRVECYDSKKEWKFRGISRKYLVRKNPGTGPFPNGITAFARIFDEETGDAREPSIKIFRNGGFQITGIRTPHQSKQIVIYMREVFHSLGEEIFQETPTPSWFTSVSMMNTDVSIGHVIHRKIVQEILHTENLRSTYESTSYQGVNIKFYWNPGRAERGEEQTGDCPCEVQCSSNGKKRAIVKPTDAPSTTCTRITIAPFQKGKIVITAAKNERQLHDAVRWILNFLLTHRHRVIGKPVQIKVRKPIVNPFKRSQRCIITVPVNKIHKLSHAVGENVGELEAAI